MDFTLPETATQAAAAGRAVGIALSSPAVPSAVIARAVEAGVFRSLNPMAASAAVEELTTHSVPAALVLALHLAVALGLAGRRDGSTPPPVWGMALATEQVPAVAGSRVAGRASWVAPLVSGATAVIGAYDGGGLVACAVPLNGEGVSLVPVSIDGLEGWSCGHLELAGAACDVLGPPGPFMVSARMLLAAVGLGIGRRALSAALDATRGLRGRGAGGEQIAQGLLADAATSIEAARMLLWKAASSTAGSLADASMAKLAATEAAQGAVVKATQLLGAVSIEHGHPVADLSRDVRVLELFAGRTEALRDAVGEAYLPQAPTV